MQFIDFKTAVAKRFAEMSKQELFVTDVSGDELWQTYLTSFPEGSNPIFRERTEHDCSCCKQFIRNIGNVVSITDGKLQSIWDGVIPGDNGEYRQVAFMLSNLVKSRRIKDLYRHYERSVGTDKNFEDVLGTVKTWEHFYVNLPSHVFMKKDTIPTYLGERRALHDVLFRSIREITDEAVDTTLELIDQGTLYRGTEHKAAVAKFKDIRNQCKHLDDDGLDLYVWTTIATAPPSVCKIRNTAIGTLLVDLSDGVKDLEQAVKAFERVMAPANYKRPTALVTKSMIESAKKTVEELGLLSALTRRYATVNDITVNNLLFVDRQTKSKIEGTVFDDMLAAVPVAPKTLDKVDDVTIQQFIEHILPSATSVDLLLENKHSGNLMSLITAVDPTATKLFKWDNSFSWTYNGDVTDSIKERVKAAGGNVTGELCIRLAWDYADDLDLHMQEPMDHLYFGNRRQKRPSGGQLDLDANGCDGIRADPAENIVYETTRRMPNGNYRVYVNNYSRRSDGVGFEMEIELNGSLHSFAYDRVIKSGENVFVADITKNGDTITVMPKLPTSVSSKNMWGLQTNHWQKVNAVMLSPNFWDDMAVGNKHFFFMLDGCANEGVARGFYNEFLLQDLDKHRKALELVGSKVKTATSAEQLSGLGFSSTQKGSVKCRVNGSFSRVINILF